MAKGKIGGGKRQVIRRTVSRRQRENKIQRLIFAIGISVIVVVIALMGSGWYLTQVRPFQQTIMKVNDTDIKMRLYVTKLVISGPSEAEDQIRQYELERQTALKLGISVSEDEARTGLKDELLENGWPETSEYLAVLKHKVLVNKLQDEYFEQEVPITAPQKDLQAMFLAEEAQANDIRDRILAGEDFSELAATLSLDQTTEINKGNIGWHPRGVLSFILGSTVVDDIVLNLKKGDISQPIHDAAKSKFLGYWLINVLEKDGEKANIQLMLLGTEKEAGEIRARLEGGEDFITLAKEFSQMPGATTDGGDVGWVNKGERGELFDSFIFDSDVTAPILSPLIYDGDINTKGGYWLIKIADEADDKVIANEDREMLKERA
ncbi:MAG: peptidylprolyl isomerase, partial [Chloroflexota bacterium]